METITGYVESITYRNEENGYSVFHINNSDGTTTCVGKTHFLNQGDSMILNGEYVLHPVHGHQFSIITYEIKEPDDLISIERYLGSGAIKGVRAALAGKIVKRFGEDTFRIIEEEPERLVEIKGISERLARQISEQVEEKKGLRNAMIYLQKFGISTVLSVKIYQKYKSEIYKVIQGNPYQIADEVTGVGFRIADEIARQVGICADSDFRIQSGIFYILMQGVQEGHMYLLQSELITRTANMLQIELKDLDRYLMDLVMAKKIVIKHEECDNRVYPSFYYNVERNTACMLHELNLCYDIADVVVNQQIFRIEEKLEQTFEEKQRQAVVEAFRNGILIVTGGPGTGKTTMIKAMIHLFEAEGLTISLAAPTGRAAKRMTEATGCEARTIHRLLEVNGNLEEKSMSGFLRNKQNPLETDVVIIDELSMVDIVLMHGLLSAIVPGTRVILVGDQNQLPSVGPGSVLKDIICSGKFKTVHLTKVFRQASKSDIVMNAHKINKGEMVLLDNKSEDFFFLRRNDPNVIVQNMVQMIQGKLPAYVGATANEIQVLSPMRQGTVGVEELNKQLQRYLNPPSKQKNEKVVGERIFRVGDKVMQIKNNYQLEWKTVAKYGIVIDQGLGVYNGDMGLVTEIDTFHENVEVTYDDGRIVNYPYKMLEELEHAYAITIHKSQGSEYPAVIIPLLQGPRLLYNRNLIYTAITRAKKCVTVIGDDRVLYEMIMNQNEQKRNTSLAEQIQECSELM